MMGGSDTGTDGDAVAAIVRPRNEKSRHLIPQTERACMIFASMGWNPEVHPFSMAENSSPPTSPCAPAKSAAFRQMESIKRPSPKSSGKFAIFKIQRVLLAEAQAL